MTTSHVRPVAARTAGPQGSTIEKKTFCCICEASCGLIATVQHDRVTVSYTHLTLPTNREV